MKFLTRFQQINLKKFWVRVQILAFVCALAFVVFFDRRFNSHSTLERKISSIEEPIVVEQEKHPTSQVLILPLDIKSLKDMDPYSTFNVKEKLIRFEFSKNEVLATLHRARNTSSQPVLWKLSLLEIVQEKNGLAANPEKISFIYNDNQEIIGTYFMELKKGANKLTTIYKNSSGSLMKKDIYIFSK